MSEIVRAGIEAVPRGQWEACRTLGLGRYVSWRYVILPQALRIVLPRSLANMMVSLLKGTSILFNHCGRRTHEGDIAASPPIPLAR